MRKQTLSESGFEWCRKHTHQGIFLEEIDRVVSWRELREVIEPFYPNP